MCHWYYFDGKTKILAEAVSLQHCHSSEQSAHILSGLTPSVLVTERNVDLILNAVLEFGSLKISLKCLSAPASLCLQGRHSTTCSHTGVNWTHLIIPQSDSTIITLPCSAAPDTRMMAGWVLESAKLLQKLKHEDKHPQCCWMDLWRLSSCAPRSGIIFWCKVSPPYNAGKRQVYTGLCLELLSWTWRCRCPQTEWVYPPRALVHRHVAKGGLDMIFVYLWN